MALILCIETATRICSVSLCRGEKILALRESGTPNVHSSMLTVFIEEIVKSTGISLEEIDAVAVSAGPGSYTGLRIGVATAKGLCYALDKPLIAVPTLQAMARGMSEQPQDHAERAAQAGKQLLYCPMIDARRMEVYCGLYDHLNREVREVRAEIIGEGSFAGEFNDHLICFGGDGAAKCEKVFENNPDAIISRGFEASAKYMAAIAAERYSLSKFENLAYYEPFYLKDFVAGKPRVRGLYDQTV